MYKKVIYRENKITSYLYSRVQNKTSELVDIFLANV